MTPPAPDTEIESPERLSAMWGVTLALALRVALGAVMAGAWLAIAADLSPLPDVTLYGQLDMPTSPMGRLVLGVWPRWDAVHHLNLAMRGYFDLSPGDSVFYPLYASITRIVAFVLGGEFILAGLIVSTVSTAIALNLIWLIGDHLYGPGSGKWASIALATYPTTVFLVAPFTESLFLALTLGAIYFAYKGRWLRSGFLAFLGSLTRGPGIFLAVPLALIWYPRLPEMLRRRSLRSIIPGLIAVAAPLAGGLAFLAWRSLAGFPPMAATLRQYSGVSFVDPLTGVFLALRQWSIIHDLPTTLDTFSALLFLSLTFLMFTNPRWRRVELLAYMVFTLAFLLSVNAQPATSLKAMSRYVLTLFPAFLVVGDVLAHLRPGLRLLIVTTSSGLLLLIASLYALWFFVG